MQGVTIRFFSESRRHSSDLENLVRLREFSAMLIECYPERERDIRLRLAKVENEIRARARRRARKRMSNSFQA